MFGGIPWGLPWVVFQDLLWVIPLVFVLGYSVRVCLGNILLGSVLFCNFLLPIPFQNSPMLMKHNFHGILQKYHQYKKKRAIPRRPQISFRARPPIPHQASIDSPRGISTAPPCRGTRIRLTSGQIAAIRIPSPGPIILKRYHRHARGQQPTLRNQYQTTPPTTYRTAH